MSIKLSDGGDQQMLTIITFILILGILVFIHELGHFLFAKRSGILVREFAIGMGLKIFSKKVGETLYSIRLLPIGGYVRMAGEDPEIHEVKKGSDVFLRLNEAGDVANLYLFEPTESIEGEVHAGKVTNLDLDRALFIQIEDVEGQLIRLNIANDALIHYSPKEQIQIAPWDRQFGSKRVGQKAITIFAGPLFNILLTAFLFILFVNVVPVQDLGVKQIVKSSPAQIAGLQANDRILKVDGNNIWTSDSLHYHLASTNGKTFKMTVERDNKPVNLTVTPKKLDGGSYKIGVYFKQKQVSFLQSFPEGVKLTYDWTRIMLDSLGKLFTGQLSIKSLGGPVEMGHATGKVAQAGWEPLLKWMALLSLNLGIVNLLPIPALDGSRLLFIGLEGLRGRPLNPNRESLVHFVGLAFLMMLMLVVTYNDIVRIFFT